MVGLSRGLWVAVQSIPGAAVEHNKYCVSVHYRNCDPAHLESLDATVAQVRKKSDANQPHQAIRVRHGATESGR